MPDPPASTGPEPALSRESWAEVYSYARAVSAQLQPPADSDLCLECEAAGSDTDTLVDEADGDSGSDGGASDEEPKEGPAEPEQPSPGAAAGAPASDPPSPPAPPIPAIHVIHAEPAPAGPATAAATVNQQLLSAFDAILRHVVAADDTPASAPAPAPAPRSASAWSPSLRRTGRAATARHRAPRGPPETTRVRTVTVRTDVGGHTAEFVTVTTTSADGSSRIERAVVPHAHHVAHPGPLRRYVADLSCDPWAAEEE